ncbi:hypothetical protein MTX78_19825 [Hymenobacter tibetensis]|uniref:Uncharacterized protein n=1 Tax=Hymenobacter tibetensis TaxID=497967 RepID=A0ABY4CZF1_9BACT|nr:hypothetical protein [Hymenobacter tibetensis]UOG74354.1 hypothetical protein MTX78_19825 [Hymenobacter tibetensis]
MSVKNMYYLFIGIKVISFFAVTLIYLVDKRNGNRSIKTIEYSNAYINAKTFSDEYKRVKSVDLMFKNDSISKILYKNDIKILRNDSLGVEAISIPKDRGSDDYYLIINDSIFTMAIRR